jgi:hypothetical protein
LIRSRIKAVGWNAVDLLERSRELQGIELESAGDLLYQKLAFSEQRVITAQIKELS